MIEVAEVSDIAETAKRFNAAPLMQLSKASLVELIKELVTATPSSLEVVERHVSKSKPSLGQHATAEEHTGTSASCAASSDPSSTSKKLTKSEKRNGSKKEFNIANFRQRTIAIQLQYNGGAYFGFASQAGECEDTVEKHLFDALLKLKLIESRQSCNYSRCGRTDRGVSAMGQVIALTVRSAFPKDLPDNFVVPSHPCDSLLIPSKADSSKEQPALSSVREIDYCTILNRVLPEDIRAIAWTEVDEGFSSRFSAAGRSYRYFFVKKTLNIPAMRKALEYLVGDHDFRNLCKLDVSNVSNFRREIFFARIIPFEGRKSSTAGASIDENDSYDSVWMLEITGIAFLWHMIRCIMGILFLIGENKEGPEVVLWLLDTENCPAKPFYHMAEDLPLVLNSCQFDNLQLRMQPNVLWSLSSHFEQIWERHIIAAARAENALQFLYQCSVRRQDWNEFKGNLIAKYDAKERNLRGSSSGFHTADSALCESASHPKRALPAGDDEPENKRSKSSASAPVIGSETVKESNCITWSIALHELMNGYDLYPSIGATKHQPLQQRHCADTYETRVENLSGSRKDRYERKLQLEASNTKEDTAVFFARMRNYGSK